MSSILRVAAGGFVLAFVVLQTDTAGSAPPTEERVSAVSSSEVAMAIVTDVYQTALCREPDPGGLAYWASVSADWDWLYGALIHSDEGKRVNQLRSIYLDVLGRDPLTSDCEGLRQWVNLPLPVEEIEMHVSVSPEAERIEEVRTVFRKVLGRDPIGWDNASLRRYAESTLTTEAIFNDLQRQRPQVGTYFFTWYKEFPNGWGNGNTSVSAAGSKPLAGWYDSSDSNLMAAQVAQIEDAGFDFIVVDVLAHAPASWANVRRLLDVMEGGRLKLAVLVDDMYNSTPEEKTEVTERVLWELGRSPNYFWLEGRPLVTFFAADIDFVVEGVTLRNVYWTVDYTPDWNTYNLLGDLRSEDWAFWSKSPQPVTNGAVSVMPGYDDRHLPGRPFSMYYPREDGRLYREQWERAIALRPELILVYSWNEHFERSAIEPTEGEGDVYLRMTSCYIRHARQGTMGTCP